MSKVKVMTEHETLAAVLSGRSITRFGDGEFKLALNKGPLKQQNNDPSLVARLNEILKCEGDYLVAIPRLNKKNPKNAFWLKLLPQYEPLLKPDYVYGSSLITRPDNCPWIDNDEFYDQVPKIWQGKRTVLVWGGSRKSFVPAMIRGASELHVIQSQPQQAWADRDNIMRKLRRIKTKPEVVLLCLGPAATALVPDIVELGIQAVDIGHLGAWMRYKLSPKDEYQKVTDFVWPPGAEAYGNRYIYRTRDLEYSINACTKRRTAIQAGGHVGVWPRHLSKFFGKVITFEPDPANFTALEHNCRDVAHIEAHLAALGDSHTPVNLVFHPNNIGGHHVNNAPGTTPQMLIDDLNLTDCDLIVLDIEGSELAAINGALATIQRTWPVLHLEMRGHIEKYNRGSTKTLEKTLEQLGYRLVKEPNNDRVYVHK